MARNGSVSGLPHPMQTKAKKYGAGHMRLIDFIIAALGLIFLAPLLLVVWALIRLNSPGDAYFRQCRVGRHEKPFTCLKFRTMHSGTGDRPTHETSSDNVTSIGRTLRRYKLDELPQLLNVLAGHMSLVGPRPCLPGQHELIAARRATGAFDVRPGITGLAQIRGVDMQTPTRLARIDGHYARSRSLCGDLAIIASTFAHVISGDGHASTA